MGYERVISGPGLVNIHRFAHRSSCAFVDPDAPDAAAEINKNILAINDITLNLAGYLKGISVSIGEMNDHSAKLVDTVRKFKLG